MKLNSAAHIFFAMPLLVSLCVSTPAQAAVQPFLVTKTTATQPTSFYQQQRDKLKYPSGATPLSLDFSFLQKQDSTPRIQQNISPQTKPKTSAIPSETAPIQTKREQKPNIKQQNKRSRSTLPPLSQPLAEEKHPIQERTQPHTQTQKNKSIQPQPQPSPNRRDPYDIIEAARKNHSPLQGNHLSIGHFKGDTVPFRKPNLEPFKQHFPEKINQIKADLGSNIQQHPEQIKQAIATATTDLKQRSAEKISGPIDEIRAFLQHTLKNPLSHLLKKIGISAQETAKRLQ